MDPHQPQPTASKTPAYLRLLETLTWQLQDDEADVREEATLIVSCGIQLPYAVSSERALTLVYDHQVKLFAGKDANEEQIRLLIHSLVSGLTGTEDPGTCVFPLILLGHLSFFFDDKTCRSVSCCFELNHWSFTSTNYSPRCVRVIAAQQDSVRQGIA